MKTIKKNRFLPEVIVMEADKSFTNVGLFYAWFYANYTEDHIDQSTYLLNSKTIRVGEYSTYMGYTIEYHFKPTDFFSLEHVEEEDSYLLTIVDMEELGFMYVWQTPEGVHAHRITEEEYILQKELIRNYTFNVEWFLKEHGIK